MVQHATQVVGTLRPRLQRILRVLLQCSLSNVVGPFKSHRRTEPSSEAVKTVSLDWNR